MTKDKRTGWLAELNPGDKIILVNNPRWFKTSRTVRAVSKITPTGRINIDNFQFMPDGVCLNGDNYYLEEATDEVISEVLKENRHRYFRNSVIKKFESKIKKDDLLTTDQLKAIDTILNN